MGSSFGGGEGGGEGGDAETPDIPSWLHLAGNDFSLNVTLRLYIVFLARELYSVYLSRGCRGETPR